MVSARLYANKSDSDFNVKLPEVENRMENCNANLIVRKDDTRTDVQRQEPLIFSSIFS